MKSRASISPWKSGGNPLLASTASVVLEGPLQLQREGLLVRCKATHALPCDARGCVAERQMQRRVRADAVAVPERRRRAAAQDVDAALQKIVDGELTVRDG